MCGILLNIGSENITPEHPALETIKHRGPDGSGAETFEFGDYRIGLGHRRLSIIDLSERGRQPMSYDNGRLWITFNGEIYNYREIKKELAGFGYSFNSDSDTEVVLAAYDRWGKGCLDRFNGMFAFAIFDSRLKKIFFARDRFGIKPLYYVNRGNCFRASSEIKQFLSVEGFTPRANPLRLYHFLNSGDFNYDDQTIWDGVSELPPGNFAEIDLNSWRAGDEFKPVRWYEPPFFADKLDIGFEDAVREFRRLLEDSVRLRLRSDVPVGFLLSGGVDSSTLVGLAHLMPGERNERLKTYSSCYEGTKLDEREYINEMLKFTGADSCLHFPKAEDVVEHIDKVIWHNDLPVLHGSPSVHWLLYRQIKLENDARKVIMEGQGGDEIACGYGDFHWAFLNETMRKCMFSFGKQMRAFQNRHHEPWKIICRKFFRLNFPGLVRYPPNRILRAEEFFADGKIPPIAVRREEPTVAELHRNRFTILRYILHNVDRNSMAHSREARVPFLDYRLVEFCLKLPSDLKISDGYSKRILRKAASPVLPEKIINRVDKQGYSSPVAMWAKSGLRDFFTENLKGASELPFVRKTEAMRSFDDFIDGKKPFDPLIWRIITVSKWMKMFGFRG